MFLNMHSMEVPVIRELNPIRRKRRRNSTTWFNSRMGEEVWNVRNTAMYNSAYFYLTLDSFTTEI